MAWIQNYKTRNQPSAKGPGRKTISFPNKVVSHIMNFISKSVLLSVAVLLKLKISPFAYALSEVIQLVISILLSSNSTFNHPCIEYRAIDFFQRMNETIS